MKHQRRSLLPSGLEEEFVFSGQPRKIAPVPAIPYLWPTRPVVAGEYIQDWQVRAAGDLAGLRLCRSTLDCISSHVSRRDGTCRLTDKALSCRSGRSLRSTHRDISRLKNLGYLMVEYQDGDSVQERVRVLRISVPSDGRSRQRIPGLSKGEVSPTYPLCVGGPDMGASRDD